MRLVFSFSNGSSNLTNEGMNLSIPGQYNNSLAYRLPALVTFATFAGLLTLILSVFFDLLIVGAFFRNPRLITPFTVQFLNFIVIQLVLLLYHGPLNIISHLDLTVFLNPTFCAFFKFGAWTFPSLTLLQQMIIGMDRWSALLSPVWYRAKKVKHGVRVTAGWVAFYLILYLPLFVIDTVTGVPAGQRCDIHHVMESYQVVVRVVTYYLPLCFTYVSYPALLIALRKRKNNAQIHAAVIKTSKSDVFVLVVCVNQLRDLQDERGMIGLFNSNFIFVVVDKLFIQIQIIHSLRPFQMTSNALSTIFETPLRSIISGQKFFLCHMGQPQTT